MKYLVKSTYTAMKENKLYKKGQVMTCFISRLYSDTCICSYLLDYAWKRKHFAQKYIDKMKSYDSSNDFWKVDYEIIEVE